MDSHADIIKALGGYLKVAEALGLPSGTVSAMKTRNSIGPEHWAGVVAEAKKQGKDEITLELLASLKEPRKKRDAAEAIS